MLVRVLVPTKITLFGEHAVVYGMPAIASTIPTYVNVIGRRVDEDIVRIEIKQGMPIPIYNITLKRGKDIFKVVSDHNYVKKVLSYTLTALNVCEEILGLNADTFGYTITIDSPLPAGVGLGTSAAISVGIITLCMVLNNYTNDVEAHRHEIARMAWDVEKKVQGSASPMDTFTITLGGLRYIDPLLPAAYPIDINYTLPILVGYTNRTGTTTELIKKVRSIKEKNEALFNDILSLVKYIVEEARKALIKQDLETLGMLMDINHGVLKALGVVNLEHDVLIHVLRRAGALGAKTSGAGYGGAFVILASSEESLDKLAAITEALGAKIVSKSIIKDGVNIHITDT